MSRTGRAGFRGRRRASVPALLLLAACAACAGSAGTPLERQLARQAAAVPGFPPDASIVAVDAGSTTEAWKELVRLRSEGPSPVSHQLGVALAESRGARRDLVVGGPHAPLTERVLLDAFALSRAPSLPGLRVLLVTPRPPSDGLRAAAAELEVELLHRTLPEDGR